MVRIRTEFSGPEWHLLDPQRSVHFAGLENQLFAATFVAGMPRGGRGPLRAILVRKSLLSGANGQGTFPDKLGVLQPSVPHEARRGLARKGIVDRPDS